MRKLVINVVLSMLVINTMAQTDGGDRMQRDIQVAENVLTSLIRQQIGDNILMPLEVEGSYRSGLGITFSVPNNSFLNWMVVPKSPKAPRVRVHGSRENGYSYTIETDDDGEVVSEEFHGRIDDEEEARELAERERAKSVGAKERAEARAKADEEKARSTEIRVRSEFEGAVAGASTIDAKEYNKFLIEAAKTFLADYSTVLSQLKPEERIIITNRDNEGGSRYRRFMGDEKRFFLSVEAAGADIKQYQSAKISKEQFLTKVKVVESEVEAERSQDLELLTTIFDRLYQSDLSKTFFTGDDTYYERLKDYGAIFYMQVYSSNEMERGYYRMPTVGEDRVSQGERDKKIVDLYPVFEKELKENMLEYGRTLKSLKPEEVLVFNVKLTKCAKCGIPSSLEVSVKASVLTDYMSGKLDKNGALGKMDVKKGANQ